MQRLKNKSIKSSLTKYLKNGKKRHEVSYITMNFIDVKRKDVLQKIKLFVTVNHLIPSNDTIYIYVYSSLFGLIPS